MTMATNAVAETFDIYHYDKDTTPDDIGSMPASNIGNLEKKGTVTGRITPGDSLEPDIIGAGKDMGIDVSSMWIGFFNPPSGFEIYAGDIVINPSDSTRKFQVQFIDRRPGGVADHHYECRLQTTEIERSG
jgi:hypothetical protein